jgi:Bacterial PH domain
MMTYKTSLDNLAKGVTLGVTILFFVIIAGQYSSSAPEGKSPFIFSTLLLSLIYLGTFLFRPIRYSITDEKLIIHRPLLDIKIDRTTIEKVEKLENDQLSCAVRIFGVGGLFGYWGKFSNSKIGSMTWYATRRSNAVLVTTIYNKKIVLTPNEPEKFVMDFYRQTL